MANIILGLAEKCIDIKTSAAENGSPVVLWEQYWGTSQMWNLTADGYIESVLDTRKCLDINVANRTLQLYDKLSGAGHENQKWDYDHNEFRIISRWNPNLCIDVAGNNPDNGTSLIVWEKNTGDNQKWYFDKLGDPNVKDRLNPYEALHFNDILQSEDGRCKLVMQGDGNLVLYIPNGEAPWASSTDNTDANYAVMQGDGNFVIYNGQNQWKWDSATDGHPGAFLVLQNDGNLVIYDTNGTPLWASNTYNRLSPLGIINLSYKIFVNPVTGLLPKQDMQVNIHLAVQEMNHRCIELNTNFRFRLLEEPVLIGGPNASGHANFWFNVRFLDGRSQLKELDNMAASFFDADWPLDQTNAFAWRSNAVNIFFTGIGYGGMSSFPEKGSVIGLCIDSDSNGLIHLHELGHFFGLSHTIGDDGIADTIPDNKDFNQDDLANAAYGSSTVYSQLSAAQKINVDNTFFNIMSYHENRRILTTGQLSKWDSVMGNQRANVMKA